MGIIPIVETPTVLRAASNVFIEPLLAGTFVKYNTNSGHSVHHRILQARVLHALRAALRGVRQGAG
jgi:hypothetical protein